MSHRWNCPDEWEARHKADIDASYDAREMGHWGPMSRKPYECDEANNTYDREYHYQYERVQEEIAAERRADERQREQHEREDWEMQQTWEAEQARQAEEEHYQKMADQSDPSKQPENQPENIR